MRSYLLYTELAEWWPIMSSPEDYAEEAGIFRDAIERHARSPIRTMLELGSGGGNNASYLKESYQLTLSDLSEGMLAVSEKLNPECEHIRGDMCEVRLDRTFDAVFIHDAITYMTTEADLRAALETAFIHCRPGGIALFVTDETRETWAPCTSHGGHDVGDRSLRYLEWCFDPDPDDTETTSVYSFVLREGNAPVRHLVEEHTAGLFSRDTWLRLIADVGFETRTDEFAHSEFEPGEVHELFLGLRPT